YVRNGGFAPFLRCGAHSSHRHKSIPGTRISQAARHITWPMSDSPKSPQTAIIPSTLPMFMGQRRALPSGGVPFKIVSDYQPAGDQPQAIEQLIAGLKGNERDQVLLGVTGSGKTFTMAHVIEALQRPTLIMAPNKTLAAQLYGEMKGF